MTNETTATHHLVTRGLQTEQGSPILERAAQGPGGTAPRTITSLHPDSTEPCVLTWTRQRFNRSPAPRHRTMTRGKGVNLLNHIDTGLGRCSSIFNPKNRNTAEFLTIYIKHTGRADDCAKSEPKAKLDLFNANPPASSM